MLCPEPVSTRRFAGVEAPPKHGGRLFSSTLTPRDRAETEVGGSEPAPRNPRAIGGSLVCISFVTLLWFSVHLHWRGTLRHQPTDEQSDNVQGILRTTIAEHLLEIGATEIRPLIGGFVLLAEYTDETGYPHVVTIRSSDLASWTEVGILTTRLETVMEQWKLDNRGEE